MFMRDGEASQLEECSLGTYLWAPFSLSVKWESRTKYSLYKHIGKCFLLLVS